MNPIGMIESAIDFEKLVSDIQKVSKKSFNKLLSLSLFPQFKQLEAILKHITGLLKLVESFDFDHFGDMSVHPTQNYLTALNDSVQLKMESPAFDEMRNTAENQVGFQK